MSDCVHPCPLGLYTIESVNYQYPTKYSSLSPGSNTGKNEDEKKVKPVKECQLFEFVVNFIIGVLRKIW